MKQHFFFSMALVLFLTAFHSQLAAEHIVVTVESGDTLYSIGRSYNVSVQDLIRANGIVNPRALKEGMEITVPSTYVVSKGDTLYGIARRNDITVDELCDLNDISQESILKIGQVLLLPRDKTERNESQAVRLADTETEEGKREGNGSESADSRETEQKDETQVQQTEISYAEVTDGKKIFWPHTGERTDLNGKLRGTQILGNRGDQVVSVSSGEVVWVAPYRGYGTLVMVESDDNMIYAYGGNETTYVKMGDNVSAGSVLGRLGINPIERSAKVFFFVYKNGKPVDPAKAPRG